MAVERTDSVRRVGMPGQNAEDDDLMAQADALVEGDDLAEGSMATMGAEGLMDEDGAIEIELDFPGELPEELMEVEEPGPPETQHDDNLAEIVADLAPQQLQDLGNSILEDVDSDKESRADWEKVFEEGLVLMGIKGSDEQRDELADTTEIFEGASQLYHPLITEAVTQFQSEAIKAMIPPKGPVDTHIMGVETNDKKEQSKRVRNFMNYLLMVEMDDYVEEHDKMLMYLGKSGSAFKKIWFNPVTSKIEIAYYTAEQIIVPYSATSLAKAPRITHKETISRSTFEHRVASGMYRDVEVQPAAMAYDTAGVQEALEAQEGRSRPEGLTDQDEYCVCEVHVDTVIPEFEGDRGGLTAPYIVHIEESTGEVLAIYRNWAEGDPLFERKEYFTHYPLIQSEGFYGYGFIHLLGSLARAATAALRQILDAGTLSNLQGGFKKRGTRLADDGKPWTPGEYRDVDSMTDDIRQAIMPLQFKEPSSVLYQLLGFLVDAGRRMVSLTDINVGDGNQEAPVGTTVALLERGMNVMSAVHMRMCRAMHNEFQIVNRLCGEHMSEYPYQVRGAEETVLAKDFDGSVDVVPICDPRQFSQAQRIARAQNKLQLAQQAPQVFNVREAYRNMLAEIDDSDIDRMIPPEEEAEPTDPMQENSDAIMNKPLKAFMQQNHDAHIQAHRAQLENPQLQDMGQAQQALQAHIQEHVSMRYQVQMMQAMGVQDPSQLQNVDPEQMAVMVAQAAQQVTGQAQAQAEAEQRAEEPTIEQQVLMEETQNDRMETQRKAQADQMQHQREMAEMMQDDEQHWSDVAQKDRSSRRQTAVQAYRANLDNEQKGMANLINMFEKLNAQHDRQREQREAQHRENT